MRIQLRFLLIILSTILPFFVGGMCAKAASFIPGSPSSVPLINCQGGTSSIISSVGTAATLVCSAGTTRIYWRIANMNTIGGAYVYCTDDGSTPTLTHWTFIVYPQGYQDSLGMPVVSPSAISCIASVASGITALAVQTGVAP